MGTLKGNLTPLRRRIIDEMDDCAHRIEVIARGTESLGRITAADMGILRSNVEGLQRLMDELEDAFVVGRPQS